MIIWSYSPSLKSLSSRSLCWGQGQTSRKTWLCTTNQIYNCIPRAWKVYHVHLQRYGLDKVYKFKVIGIRSKVKWGKKSTHAQLALHMTVFPKYEDLIMYSFRDRAWTRFKSSRSLYQGQRSNEAKHIPMHEWKKSTAISCLTMGDKRKKERKYLIYPQ